MENDPVLRGMSPIGQCIDDTFDLIKFREIAFRKLCMSMNIPRHIILTHKGKDCQNSAQDPLVLP